MLGLGLSLLTGGAVSPEYVKLSKAFVTRVEADGGTVESFACLKTDMAYLTSNPDAPTGYTAEWSAATVGSSAEFRINLVGGAGYTYTYAVTDTQANEVTGTGVMGGNIQAVTADLSTLVDGAVTVAVYLTGAGGDGLVVTDSALKAASGPVLLSTPVISGTAQVGETLSTTDGTWQGIATITFAYQWRRDAVNISGATSSTYTLVAADYTTDIDCVVTATNSLGSASADSNDIANIAGTAPSITSLPTISGTIEVLQTITATLGSVTGVPTPTSTLQWQISNDGVSGWTNIVGETSTTYTIAVEDDDKYLRVVQTATNAEGSDVENSASTTQVAGSAPVISGVPTISTQTQVGETITATAASVTGVPTPTTSWQWQRSADGSTGWANISGATSSTYTLVSADDTNYVRAVQTETNVIGTDSANSAASGQISSVPAFTGLLDTYSGAAAAYSLRQLSSTYTGDAIVVRRASDNTTQSIGFVNNELDTASLESFCSGTDGFVTTWYDQSGNANNATQSTASQQPQIVSAGSTIIEGTKPAFDFLTAGNFIGATGYSFTDFAAFSVIHSDITSGYPISCQSNNSTGWRQHIQGSSVFRSRMFNVNIDTSNTPTIDYTLLSTLSYGNNGYTFVDGVQEATASVTPAADTSANLEIGSALSVSSTLFNGRIQEVVIYDTDQSSNRTGIETNINSYYSIY